MPGLSGSLSKTSRCSAYRHTCPWEGTVESWRVPDTVMWPESLAELSHRVFERPSSHTPNRASCQLWCWDPGSLCSSHFPRFQEGHNPPLDMIKFQKALPWSALYLFFDLHISGPIPLLLVCVLLLECDLIYKCPWHWDAGALGITSKGSVTGMSSST